MIEQMRLEEGLDATTGSEAPPGTLPNLQGSPGPARPLEGPPGAAEVHAIDGSPRGLDME